MHSDTHDYLTCSNCGDSRDTSPDALSESPACERCGLAMHPVHPWWLDHATAYTITAAILFAVTLSFPFLALKTVGMRQEASLISGILALAERGQWLLAALVFVTIILIPLLEILVLLYLLIPYRLQRRRAHQVAVFRWLVIVQPWSMLEIFAVAVLVTMVKLGGDATIVPGVAMFAFFLLVAALMGAYLAMDKSDIWNWLNPQRRFIHSAEEPTFSCHVCEAEVGRTIIHTSGRCPRCGARVYERIPNSFQKTAALILAASILYIPANVLPMMSYTSFGTTRTDTIFSGVIALISDGLWWVALVVFIASIMVPIAKLVVLTYLLWLIKKGATRDFPAQQRLFHSLELIGRWSMIDVFVVTLLVALVQFGVFGQVEPRGAIVAFGGVVVLTMLATQTFDVRLLEDAWKNKNSSSEQGSAKNTSQNTINHYD